MLRRCIEFQMRLQCCGSPLPTATLDNVDDVGPSRRDPLRASSRFWTRNLLMSESGTSTRPPPLFCHLTSPDWTVRGPHRGVAPPLLHSALKPSSTGTSRFTLPLPLLPPPPTLHPVLAISPATPLRDGFRTAFPAGYLFLLVTISRQEEPASQTSRGSIDTAVKPSSTM